MKREKERIIRSWFEMWLHKEDTDIQDLFEENAVYIESWGPKYHGAEKIKHWFYEWNTRGEVLKWDIKQIFHNENQTGAAPGCLLRTFPSAALLHPPLRFFFSYSGG